MVSILLLGCTTSPAPVQDEAFPTIEATPNIEATVAAAIQTALPEPTPTSTPNIPLTVDAQVSKKLLDIPTSTPIVVQPTITSLRDLVDRARPSVVRIDTDQGMGSGFIAFTDGPNTDGEYSALIITNHHVIKDAQYINVTVNDRNRFGAQLIEDDPYSDIAFIEICCGDFEALEFGSNTDVGGGEQAIAIGYPLGLEGKATITDGIISATRFDNGSSVWIIQTDAAINPGNSGGPLLSSEGKVLGVNTATYTAADGIGIAVSLKTLNYIFGRLSHRAGDSIDLGDKVTYFDNAVYYLPPVTKLKAEQYMDSLLQRNVTNREKSKKWQLSLVDGEYEIRGGLYEDEKNRYFTTSELREWLSQYHSDVERRRSLNNTVCQRQVEDFDDVPTTYFIVDLTLLRFDGVVQWIPCIK